MRIVVCSEYKINTKISVIPMVLLEGQPSPHYPEKKTPLNIPDTHMRNIYIFIYTL